MDHPAPQIANPCPKKWENMRGDDQRRFCEQCQLHVHNLSTMSVSERREFTQTYAGGACVTYRLLPDGTMSVPGRWGWMGHSFRRVLTLLAAILPFAFGACTSTQLTGYIDSPSKSVPGHTPRKRSKEFVQITGEICPVPPQSK